MSESAERNGGSGAHGEGADESERSQLRPDLGAARPVYGSDGYRSDAHFWSVVAEKRRNDTTHDG